MINIGILGGAGYTAGELIRLMNHHPKVNIVSVVSHSHPGLFIHLIHQDLLGERIGNQKFSSDINKNIDVAFICSGHGKSRKELIRIPEHIRVIDLSQDFRIKDRSVFRNRKFIYGIPELQKKLIEKSDNVANPGCFATSINLSILPIAKNKLLKNNIHISAITGSTGSGQKMIHTNHFSWRNNNVSAYKIFQHQHIKEIKQTIDQLQDNFSSEIYFIPYRGNFSRGIISSIYTYSNLSLEENKIIYKEYYENHPFVHISDENIDIKQVINTNKCILYLSKEQDQLIVISILDNLVKGASGQALQNMNIMFNIEETCGLKLKSIRF